MTNHFLIGPPSSGKSTLATFLTQLDSNTVIISTDAIRAQLFGDETIQGDWSVIESEVLRQIHQTLAAKKSVIYDATNAKREWRTALLSQISGGNIQWLAWHLKTPLETCLLWNQKRHRQVPPSVITEFYQALNDVPPQPAEGFVSVYSISVMPDGLNLVQVQQQFEAFFAVT
ncbi:MAG TPA: kinase [Cyanobacteria bacterium UBA8803]|nr:kinase [Cyanobacteria bacterium UBA9273]HBL60437.1 kinase [Cyanobacteria bacterium UBA8803]